MSPVPVSRIMRNIRLFEIFISLTSYAEEFEWCTYRYSKRLRRVISQALARMVNPAKSVGSK